MTLAFDHSQPRLALLRIPRPAAKAYVSKGFSVLSELALPVLATLVGYGITFGLLILLEYSI